MPFSLPVLGVPIVDEDHLAAASLVDQACNCDDRDLPHILEHVALHLKEHFGREETMMDQCNFFAAHCHKDEHSRVLDEVVNVQASSSAGDMATVRRYLTETFPAWLLLHANTMDTITMAAYRAFAPVN